MASKLKSKIEDNSDIVDISVELDLQGLSSSDYILHVKLTHRSRDILTIYQHSLPWVGWYSILLTAIKTDALGTVIEKSLIIDDPGPVRITIKPGETLTGDIPLIGRFPDLLEALRETDVIIFWSYQLKPVDAPPFQRACGYVVLPKLSG